MEWLEWPDALDAGVVIAVSALIFAVASFWWLNGRRGSLQVARPGAYVFANKVRLRLPLAFYNTGAVALIVSDLRVLVGEDTRQPLPWIAALPTFRPRENETRDLATPFAVPGHGTREFVAEFGDNRGWSPEPSSRHTFRLQARLHPTNEWSELAAFDWWAPPAGAKLAALLAYRNSPEQDP